METEELEDIEDHNWRSLEKARPVSVHQESRNLYGKPAIRLSEGMLQVFIRKDATR